MPTDAPVYEHRQISRLMPAAGAVALLVMIAWASGTGGILPWLAVAIVIGVVAVFHALTIRVDDTALSWCFGLGMLGRTVPLAGIAAAFPVRNRWWYGWGIRYTPHGWLYNVDGLGAVEVTRRNGKRFRLGTDEPDALARALASRLED